MTTDEVKHLLDECKTIEENCLYTGQTHFVMAEKIEKKKFWLVFIPSLLAVVAGAYSAIYAVNWAAAVASISAGIAGLTSFLGIEREAVTHNSAGNLLSIMRHEARILHESLWKEIPREHLCMEVRKLNDKYQIACFALDVTDSKSFELARKRIKSGVFKYDFRQLEKKNGQ